MLIINKIESLHVLVLIVCFTGGFFVSSLSIKKKSECPSVCNVNKPLKDVSIMLNGDVTVYNEIVKHIKATTPSHPDYFTYSLYMANRYNYIPANYDVYTALRDVYRLNDLKMDVESKKFALFYLYRAAKLGDKRAIKELKKYHYFKFAE
jgi:hypothetical protein